MIGTGGIMGLLLNMTDRDILQKVIAKAGNHIILLGIFNDSIHNLYGNNLRMDLVRGYIFSHDFAKAFFGEKGTGIMKASTNGKAPREIMQWEMHLHQMVVEENPINYLKNFI